MSRKNLIVLITIILAIFVIALLGYYFIITANQPIGGTTATGSRTFTPFGSNPATSTNPITGIANPNPQITNYTQKLRKIWSEPVAGAGLVDVKAGTVVRHVEVATGHIYETELFSPRQDRISNTTIPLIYNAFWGNNNQTFVGQYIKDDNRTVDTYVLSVKDTATSTENPISAYLLSSKIEDVSVLGDTMFYLEQSTTGTQGYISALDGLKRKEIWNSPLREILSQIINGTSIALTTKPYQNIPGYLYVVNANTGSTRKILGDMPGLSDSMSPNGLQVLYLTQTNTVELALYTIKNESAIILSPVTFPEKCVWSKKDTAVVYCAVPHENLDGTSLTSWYMGKISFTDDIWRYDLKQNTSRIIENLSEDSGEPIDVIKPQLSTSEQYLVFINKRDGALWSLDLSK